VRPALALTLALLALGGEARADEADECLSAPVEGQKLQRAGKLLEARERFRACALRACPTVIIHDCDQWTKTVNDALPSIVIVARDASGKDVEDATMAVDGAAPVAVPAHAIELDPGPHVLSFRRGSAPATEQRIVLREAEKDRAVNVTFGEPPPAPPPPPPPPPREIETSRPVPLAAIVFGGVAVAAFGTSATFGALGLGERSAHDCANGCTADQRDSALTKLRVADVALAVGLVSAGVALWLYLSRPAASRVVP
jgi:hypothetical protein